MNVVHIRSVVELLLYISDICVTVPMLSDPGIYWYRTIMRLLRSMLPERRVSYYYLSLSLSLSLLVLSPHDPLIPGMLHVFAFGFQVSPEMSGRNHVCIINVLTFWDVQFMQSIATNPKIVRFRLVNRLNRADYFGPTTRHIPQRCNTADSLLRV